MAAQDSASVTLRGRFPVGTKVGLHKRTGDFFRGGKPLTTETVSKDGTVSFDGLPEGGKYFVAGDVDGHVRSAHVTAKVQPEAKQRLDRAEVREALRTTRPAKAGPRMLTGPRSSTNSRATGVLGRPFASEDAGKPTPKGELEAEPTPHVRQEDARDVPQRSATITGMATPKDPDEIVPAPSQSDIPASTPQRSATPEGIATPKRVDEEAPAARQEDVRDLDQRSATEAGQAEPKPSGSAVKAQEAKDSSMAKARGGREAERASAKPTEKALQRPAQRKQSGTNRSATTAKRTTTKDKE